MSHMCHISYSKIDFVIYKFNHTGSVGFSEKTATTPSRYHAKLADQAKRRSIFLKDLPVKPRKKRYGYREEPASSAAIESRLRKSVYLMTSRYEFK